MVINSFNGSQVMQFCDMVIKYFASLKRSDNDDRYLTTEEWERISRGRSVKDTYPVPGNSKRLKSSHSSKKSKSNMATCTAGRRYSEQFLTSPMKRRVSQSRNAPNWSAHRRSSLPTSTTDDINNNNTYNATLTNGNNNVAISKQELITKAAEYHAQRICAHLSAIASALDKDTYFAGDSINASWNAKTRSFTVQFLKDPHVNGTKPVLEGCKNGCVKHCYCYEPHKLLST